MKQDICFASHSFARRGNIYEQQCFRNNVSATMFPSLRGPFLEKQTTRAIRWIEIYPVDRPSNRLGPYGLECSLNVFLSKNQNTEKKRRNRGHQTLS